jgi:hypothetical protein
MTVVLQFLNVDKNIMEYISVTNVPCVNLFFLLSNQARFENLLRSVYSILERDYSRSHYLFHGIYAQHRSRRKLLCSFDFNGLGEASSIV